MSQRLRENIRGKCEGVDGLGVEGSVLELRVRVGVTGQKLTLNPQAELAG